MGRIPEVLQVVPLTRYRIGVRFADGWRGYDMAATINSPEAGVFASLRDPAVFREVRAGPESGTAEWPNGIDLCPDTLYEEGFGLSEAELRACLLDVQVEPLDVA